MDEGIEELVSAVVAALDPESVARVIAVHLRRPIRISEVAAVLRMLGQPGVEFRPGERPQQVLERMRELYALLPSETSIR